MNINGVETIIGVNSYGDGTCHDESAATRVDTFDASFIEPIMQGVAAQ